MKRLEKENEKYYQPIFVPSVPEDNVFPNGMRLPEAGRILRKPLPMDITGFLETSSPTGGMPHRFTEVMKRRLSKCERTPHTGELLPKGKIAVDEENRRLYYDEEGRPITGFSDNWWVGLELFHSLFAMEHNAIVDRLSQRYPDMTDEELFQKARLVVAALIAKIHTIEWTPALLDNPAIHIGMRANWHGLKESVKVFKVLRWLVRMFSKRWDQAIYGATGKGTLYHYNVPFSLTEEFVAVYRMHPLIPDNFHIYNSRGDRVESLSVKDTLNEKARDLVYRSPTTALSLMYSLGVDHPGALTLHNYPQFMQNLRAINNTEGMSEVRFDLAALDIVRDRERLVPRYNEFRRELRLKPIETFSDLTSNPEDVALLEKIYGGDVEKLDLLVGTLAENDRYEGFAFGNTPFYIFAVMASRRLMADPFFSDYFTPEVYTPEGFQWVQRETMVDVIVRHYPELKSAFKGVTNAFQPWRTTGHGEEEIAP